MNRYCLERNHEESNLKIDLLSNLKKIGQCIDAYPKIKRLCNRLKAWIYNNNPHLYQNLLFEGQLNFGYRDELKDFLCFILNITGQKDSSSQNGIFGTYAFYDIAGSQFIPPQKFNVRNKLTDALSIYPIIFRLSPNNGNVSLSVGIALEDIKTVSGNSIEKGSIVYISRYQSLVFVVANSFSEYLEEYVLRLENGYYRMKHGTISLFPNNCKPITTDYVSIAANALFIPSMSVESSFVFAYEITISMDKDVDMIHECQLLSRHWEITDGDESHIVEGDGVIGKTPILAPGTVFEYESQCMLKSTQGSMKGYFTFINRHTNQIFRATIPEMLMKMTYPCERIEVHKIH